MTPRRVALAIALLLAVIAACLFWPRGRETFAVRRTEKPASTAPLSPARPPADRPTAPPHRAGADTTAAASPATAPFNPADFPIAAPLNAPDSTVSHDLDILQQLFDAWRTNFPREGNPVGENADITAALAGANRLGLALIPKTHPAINARGELCDRWGTPFRFHQLSGERMEVRSAGPDRKFATEDDAVWTPP